mmetsp:Transcript_3672/g.7974  ORF Transcript_3672/g.7974 Transcript_3672/m.7974 type:complete len:165 (+) Transcript_3672:3-497(+)
MSRLLGAFRASAALFGTPKGMRAPIWPMRRVYKKKKPFSPMESWKIFQGDHVEIIAGKDKGKRGDVLKVKRKTNRVIVEGLNLAKKHFKSGADFKGGVNLIPAPIHVSNVSLICPQTNEATKVERKYLEDGTKVRIAKKSGAIIPKPVVFTRRYRPGASSTRTR